MSKNNASANEELPLFPLLEIFGGTLGVLLLFIFLLLFQQERIKEQQKDPKNIGGIAQMKMGEQNTGYVVSCFEDHLRIEETKEEITLAELREVNNRFWSYCKDIYTVDQEKGICAFVYPGSNDVVMEIEKMFIYSLPEAKKYNFLVINEEIMENLFEISERNLGK